MSKGDVQGHVNVYSKRNSLPLDRSSFNQSVESVSRLLSNMYILCDMLNLSQELFYFVVIFSLIEVKHTISKYLDMRRIDHFFETHKNLQVVTVRDCWVIVLCSRDNQALHVHLAG